MFSNDLAYKMFETFFYLPNEYAFSPFWTPNDVIDHKMYIVTFVLIIHVYSRPLSTEKRKSALPPCALKGRAIHLPLERREMNSLFTVKPHLIDTALRERKRFYVSR